MLELAGATLPSAVIQQELVEHLDLDGAESGGGLERVVVAHAAADDAGDGGGGDRGLRRRRQRQAVQGRAAAASRHRLQRQVTHADANAGMVVVMVVVVDSCWRGARSAWFHFGNGQRVHHVQQSFKFSTHRIPTSLFKSNFFVPRSGTNLDTDPNKCNLHEKRPFSSCLFFEG